MTGQDTHDTITSLNNSVSKIAQNDALKGLLPVIDQFLTAVQANQGGTVGLLAQVHALLPNLEAALPNIGNQVVKDEAGAIKETVDDEAAKAAATDGTATETGHTEG
jgi:hypothetical protein